MDGSSNSESPIETKKTKSKTPRKPKETLLKQSLSHTLSISQSQFFVAFFFQLIFLLNFLKFVESPAEFFAENKNIAGFDNVCRINCTTMCLIWHMFMISLN